MSTASDGEDEIPQAKNYIITGGHKDQRIIHIKKSYAPKTKGAGYSQNPKTLERFLIKHNLINRTTGSPFPMTSDLMLRYLEIKSQSVLPSNVSWYRDAAVWGQKQLGYDADLVEKEGKHPDVNEFIRECNQEAKRNQVKEIDGAKRVMEIARRQRSRSPLFDLQQEQEEQIPTKIAALNLPVGITTDRVKGLFANLSIRNIAVLDRADNSSAGARVTFSSRRDAKAAITRWNNKSYNGRLIKVKLMEEKIS